VLVRWLWRAGKLAFYGGRYVTQSLAVTA
jgi:hypothetical protein